MELDKEGWKKHLEDLRAASVLAHQATEFESHKNRTEGKSKCDILGQSSEPLPKAVAVVEPTNIAALSPARIPATVPKTEAKIEVKTSPAKSEAKVSPVFKTESKSTPTKGTPKKLDSQPSELEKLAAAQAAQAAQQQKTPQEATPIKVVAAPKANIPEKPEKTESPKKTEKVAPETPKPSKTFEVAKPLNSPIAATPPRPVLKRNKDSLQDSKPLNVLVYSDSASARDSTLATLEQLLERNVYTIYPLMPQQAAQKYWTEQTALLVVCGSVAPGIGQVLVDYFLQGGKVLSLCSDILHFILPNYRTAEVSFC